MIFIKKNKKIIKFKLRFLQKKLRFWQKNLRFIYVLFTDLLFFFL